MKKEFIPYEQTLDLKELGFDEPCFGNFYTKPNCKMFGVDEKGRHYTIKNTPKKLYTLGEHFVLNDSNVINAPLYQQAFRWFREKYSYHHSIYYHKSSKFECRIADSNDNNLSDDLFGNMYLAYEEAELECLKKLIEIVKLKK